MMIINIATATKVSKDRTAWKGLIHNVTSSSTTEVKRKWWRYRWNSNENPKTVQNLNYNLKIHLAFNWSKWICFYPKSFVTIFFLNENVNNQALPFFVFRVLLQSVENIPSVQSFVATSSLPNICGAVIAFGFMRISRWGIPQSVIAFIRVWIHAVLPAPEGPRVIIPWRTLWVSYSLMTNNKIDYIATWIRIDFVW